MEGRPAPPGPEDQLLEHTVHHRAARAPPLSLRTALGSLPSHSSRACWETWAPAGHVTCSPALASVGCAAGSASAGRYQHTSRPPWVLSGTNTWIICQVCLTGRFCLTG